MGGGSNYQTPPPPIYKKRQKTPNIFSLPAPGWLFLDLHKNYCHNLTQPQFELVWHNNELTKSCSSSCATSTRNSYPSSKQPRELKFWIQLHFSNPKLEKTTFKINKWGGGQITKPPLPQFTKKDRKPLIFSVCLHQAGCSWIFTKIIVTT